ncbi:UDP-glucose 6-dehydrogenase [Hydrogenovibrio sp. SC-1]|uniref:UDP-glucose dehydrogenase family protein n=1 Tax=Hydrogenovibrio sp. SC-1 TaxID=2065820 RepID=UPI000C7DD2DF|nr:UDP-glucose/GDP-mannose dehydrogenase family protein [Hydrogenovibrio sp. SC-1]PLA74343.1 UDP-glucose 6-dehydrogenase [Hydrogenovibrio sp. SC-1]
MKISVFGTGYVGLVTGACLSEVGHDVICVDHNSDIIAQLTQGKIPIWEPGLESIVQRNHQVGNLTFTTDARQAVEQTDVIFIAVGTPPGEDGSADLQQVLAVSKEIALAMNGPKLLINKSTVPVGTAPKVQETVTAHLEMSYSFSVVSNPEFLKEGSAVTDFMKPDRIIVGVDNDAARETLKQLYAPFNRNHDRMVFMDVPSAELTKYAANTLLATKISFMNELANLAEDLGADIESVRQGIGSDPRIGYHFIYPGCGYGGSCFPKDVKALIHIGQSQGHAMDILNSVEAVNKQQKDRLFNKLARHYGSESNLKGLKFAVWGLTFKPNTDDLREAPSLNLIQDLLRVGARVQVFDPVAMDEAKQLFNGINGIDFCQDKYAALNDADALILVTEWRSFQAPDFVEMEERLTKKTLFDGRNQYDPHWMKEQGWHYEGIGRGVIGK